MMMIVVELLCATAMIWLTYGYAKVLPTKKNDDTRKFWITKVGSIHEDLLNAQAIIAKDEEMKTGASSCQLKTADTRYSDKRYLMCAGSILSSRLILTSASCIHEATYIRHNVQSPLVAMIAPFSDTTQVIKISDYSIHPSFQVDPREEDYPLHNIAVAKLSCKISKPNLKVIELPTESTVEYCNDDTCFLTVIKKTSPLSYVMFETPAKNFPGEERDKRELSKATYKSRVAEILKKVNNESSRSNRDFNMRSRRSVVSDKYSNGFPKNSVPKEDKLKKKITIRSSDGTKGCPQRGSAVMFEKIQTSLIASSCDDRQPETAWQLTDLNDNLDWIYQMLGRKMPSRARTMSSGGCQTCIYNFYFNYNISERPPHMCNNEGFGQNTNNFKIPSIPCATTYARENNSMRNLFDNQLYLQNIHDLYTNRLPQNRTFKDNDLNLNSENTFSNMEANSNKLVTVNANDIQMEGYNEEFYTTPAIIKTNANRYPDYNEVHRHSDMQDDYDTLYNRYLNLSKHIP